MDFDPAGSSSRREIEAVLAAKLNECFFFLFFVQVQLIINKY